MNCIIIDDEPLAREEMQLLVEEVSALTVAGIFSNALQAADFLQRHPIDLIFLDIEMPLLNGLVFAEQIPETTLIIFTTAYPQYALKSYELDAIDYLLKPIDKNRLQKAINKASIYKQLLVKETEKSAIEKIAGDNSLLIKSDRRFYKINIDDILFVEGLKDYVVVHLLHQQKLITAMNLKTMLQQLPALHFFRVSKSYVVNINHIESFDTRTICINDSEIPLGEVYKKDFFEQYSKYFK